MTNRMAAIGLLLLSASPAAAQETPQDHSFTVDAAAIYLSPSGSDGNDSHNGWGFAAGAGARLTRQSDPVRTPVLYLDGDFLYSRLEVASAALDAARSANSSLAEAASAPGAFSALTFDPTVRFPVGLRSTFYLPGGYGWLHRGLSFNGANPQTFMQPGGPSMGKLSSNSGVFDAGGGVNFGLSKRGGLMLYAEVRV